MTTTIRGTDNTAAAPALTGTDTDTGIFFPAADTIAFAEGGAEVARFNSSGDFGIGTSSPASRLHVTGLARICDPAAYILFRNAADNTSNGVVQFPDTGEASIVNYRNTDLTLGTNNNTRVRITAAGDFQYNNGYGSVATVYGCRAWVNFNGASANPITPTGSGNVSSVSKTSTGVFTVNLTNAMPDTNFAFTATTRTSNTIAQGRSTATTSSTIPIGTATASGAGVIDTVTHVAVFR